MKKCLVAVLLLVVAGCSTYTPQRYSISADNNVALKALKVGNVNVGPFTGPVGFDPGCRAAGPIGLPDGMTFEGYVQKALMDELKVAGMFDAATPRVTLSGAVESLAFSSMTGLTGGTWDITLRVTSSNGRSVVVSEHYAFRSGFVADTACKQTAEAYYPAVQNVINKLVTHPQFRDLITA